MGTYDYSDLFDVVAYKGQERKYMSCKHLPVWKRRKAHCECKKFIPGKDFESLEQAQKELESAEVGVLKERDLERR